MSPFDVAVTAVVMGTVSGTLISFARLRYRHLESRERGRRLDGDLEDRILRIEQAVDAIAVEVERMSESQRFTQRLLAERLPDSLPPRP